MVEKFSSKKNMLLLVLLLSVAAVSTSNDLDNHEHCGKIISSFEEVVDKMFLFSLESIKDSLNRNPLEDGSSVPSVQTMLAQKADQSYATSLAVIVSKKAILEMLSSQLSQLQATPVESSEERALYTIVSDAKELSAAYQELVVAMKAALEHAQVGVQQARRIYVESSKALENRKVMISRRQASLKPLQSEIKILSSDFERNNRTVEKIRVMVAEAHAKVVQSDFNRKVMGKLDFVHKARLQ